MPKALPDIKFEGIHDVPRVEGGSKIASYCRQCAPTFFSASIRVT